MPSQWRLGAVLFCLSYAALVSGCEKEGSTPTSPPPTATPEPLLIGLADEAARIEDVIRSGYLSEESQGNIEFVAGNRATLLEDIQEERFDAIIVHSPEEESGLWINPIVMDGLVAIVHPANPVSDVTLSNLFEIFSGNIDDWSQVGGEAGSVKIKLPIPGTGAFDHFQEMFLAGLQFEETASIIADYLVLQEEVRDDIGAVGLIMGGLLEDSRAVAIDGIRPENNNFSSQQYPLTIPVYIVASSEPQGQLRRIVAWLQSEEGQTLLSEYYGRVR